MSHLKKKMNPNFYEFWSIIRNTLIPNFKCYELRIKMLRLKSKIELHRQRDELQYLQLEHRRITITHKTLHILKSELKKLKLYCTFHSIC